MQIYVKKNKKKVWGGGRTCVPNLVVLRPKPLSYAGQWYYIVLIVLYVF